LLSTAFVFIENVRGRFENAQGRAVLITFDIVLNVRAAGITVLQNNRSPSRLRASR